MPSPKSGTAGTVITVIDPTEAMEAVDDKSGDPQAVTAKPAQKKKFKPTQTKVPPFKPLTGSPPAAGAPPSTDACCEVEVEVVCEHDERKAKNQLLQIVPQRRVARRSKLQLGPFSAEEAGGFGADTVTITVKQKKGAASACQCKPEIVISGADSKRTKDRQMTLWAKPPMTEPFWSYGSAPTQYFVDVDGCQSPPPQTEIDCFPPAEASIEIDLKEWERDFDWLKNGLNGIVTVLNGQSLTDDQFEFLKGKIKGSWGWKEFKDNRAYFEVDVSLGLIPLVSFKALTLPVSAIEWMPAVIRQNAADLNAFIKLDGEFNVNGYWKSNGPDSSNWDVGGRAEIGVIVYLGIEAKAGAKKVLQVVIGAQLKAPFKGKMDFVIYDGANGPGVVPELKWDGLVGEVYCNVKGQGVFKWFQSENSDQFVFCKGGDIYTGGPWYPFLAS